MSNAPKQDKAAAPAAPDARAAMLAEVTAARAAAAAARAEAEAKAAEREATDRAEPREATWGAREVVKALGLPHATAAERKASEKRVRDVWRANATLAAQHPHGSAWGWPLDAQDVHRVILDLTRDGLAAAKLSRRGGKRD